MTREDIVRMAKEAGMESFNICVELDDFAALVASAERKACAKIVEEHAKVHAKLEKNPATSAAWAACIDIHDSISERGDA